MSQTKPNQTPDPDQEINDEHQPQFSVVGMGASAGGLAGLKTFFDHMPDETGLAFVVVMHLSPEHQSHLPELLQIHTNMTVTQVAQTMEILPNHVYVIPPNRNLSAIDTHLRLVPLEESRQQRAPIDHFFRTLAVTHRNKAIGIVLSGTGADGAVGLKKIKEEGGLAIVQDPVEAEYDSMPQSAIATGLVDLILPVAAMPAQIQDFVQMEPHLPHAAETADLPESDEALLQKIFVYLRTHAGHDFSGYKHTTVMRRVRRRMQLQKIETLAAYLQHLREHPEEVPILFRDLLITVTNFFRDPEAFSALEKKILPQIFARKGHADTVRVWAIGCATGEEAYTVAMLLLEQCARLEAAPEIQVFASDISDEALTRAREGLYPEGIAADVSPARLARFFLEETGGFRIKKEVRDVVLFAEHNLLNDPPFSRLDLITCRNLLIYLQREVQEKVNGLFHYALKPEGFLFLGSSESINAADLFRPIDKKMGLYQRRAVAAAQVNLPSLPVASRPLPRTLTRTKSEAKEIHDSFGALHQEVVEQYAPPSVLINEDFNIVHLSRHAGRYLHQPGGEPTHSILQRIRPALRTELTTALYGAFERDRPSRTKPIRVQLDGEQRRVSMSVHPATNPDLAGFVLIVFIETEDVVEQEGEGLAGDERESVVRELEEELTRTKERLQTAVEEFESSKEEMRASNEELQSMNEELRSTAEELETSKEELQSMNEELLTVNQENKIKVEELSQLSNDLQNLLASTNVATLFLDRELRIRRFTPRVADLFNMMPADRGRPLAHITHKLQGDSLLADAAKVLAQLSVIEREMVDVDGNWYLVRLRPYRSNEDRIEGVVVTFVDVTPMKQTEEKLRASSAFQEDIIHTIREGLLVLNLDLRVEFANQPFYQMFAVKEMETVGTLIYQLGNGQWDIPELRRLLEEVLPNNQIFNDYEMAHEFETIGWRAMRLNGRRLDGQQRILLAIEDITARQQALNQLKQMNETLEKEVNQRTRKIRELASDLLEAEQNVRQRIARTLHDDLQQIIYSMRVPLEQLTRIQGNDVTADLRKRITELDDMMQSAFTMTRQMARELKPPVAMGETLPASMAKMALYFKELHALDVDIIVHDDVTSKDADTHYLLFNMVRELLFNVVKHAEINSATVEIGQADGALHVNVRDSGKGFDAEKLLAPETGGGFGLHDIREQVTMLNGRLEINSIPGDGTRVDIFIPLMNET